MKKTTIFAFLLLVNFTFFSCSNEDEETPDPTPAKEMIKVSLGSLKVNQSDAINGRTSAVPSSVEFIDVVYGPYPDFVSSNHGDITERVIESFPVDEFPDNYTIELEKDREYYVAIAAYSIKAPVSRPIYKADYRVSMRQPVILSEEITDDLKSDFYSFSKIFTAEDNMNIDAVLNRVSAQFRIQMPDGVDLPSNAVKGEVNITDDCADNLGAIYFDFPYFSDVCGDFTYRYFVDLTTNQGINTIFHTMPMSNSGRITDIIPLQISVKLLDALDMVIAEGTAQMDTIHKNRLYNLVLDPGVARQSISIDVDETIQEEVDVIVE